MQNGIGFRLYDWIYKNLLKWCILCVYVWKHHGNNLTHNFRMYDINPWPDPFQHRTDCMIWTKLIHWIFTINYILITLPLSGIMMLWRIKKSNTMAALLGLKESWTISSGSWNKRHHMWISILYLIHVSKFETELHHMDRNVLISML